MLQNISTIFLLGPKNKQKKHEFAYIKNTNWPHSTCLNVEAKSVFVPKVEASYFFDIFEIFCRCILKRNFENRISLSFFHSKTHNFANGLNEKVERLSV